MRGLFAELCVLAEKNAALIRADDGLACLLSIGVDPDHIHVDSVPAAPHLDPVEFWSVD
jgi:hypothetical protein